MNTTEFALKLIQDYNTENNKLRRAKAAQYAIFSKSDWHDMAASAGVSSYYYKDCGLSRREAEKTFLDASSQQRTWAIFVSASAKNGAIRSLKRQLNRMTVRNLNSDFIEDRLSLAQGATVNTKLGKIWRKIVNAHFDEIEANRSRWEVRCAIRAFNKMNLGIKIHFGNCRSGSMTRISHVEVNGDNIKLARFLDNAIFETAVLNANPNT